MPRGRIRSPYAGAACSRLTGTIMPLHGFRSEGMVRECGNCAALYSGTTAVL
jgi:hypothetical protein